jgi:tetratricopeptide (TPR) repeat protein
MIGRLEEARLPPINFKGDDYDLKWSHDQYIDAFQKYGIDIQGLTVEEVGSRIRQRTIGVSLVAALDDWAVKTRDPSQRGRLVAIARAADYDRNRDQIRAAYLHNDRRVLKTLSASADVNATPVPTLLLLEAALESLKELKAAADLLRRAQAVHAGDFWINHRLGVCVLAQAPAVPANAVAFFMVAAAARPDSAIARSNLGSVLYKMGHLDAAMTQYREALRLKPDLAVAHGNLGNIYKRRGLLEDAIREYREAIRLDKDFAAPHSNLGDAFTRQGKRNEAIAEFREAIRLKDDFEEAHANLAAALAAKGRLDEAAAECAKIIRINRTLVAQAHQRIGVLLELKGQRQESMDHFAAAHCLQALALHQKRDLKGAIAEYRRALRLRPGDARTLDRLGIVLAAQGDLDAAIAAFRRAIDLKYDFVQAHNDLALALCDKGLFDAAITECRQALRLEEDNPLAYFRLGTALTKKGDFRSALDAVRRGHELASRDRHARWGEETAQWVREHERYVELDDRLPAILLGKSKPASAQEVIEFAELCTMKHLYAAAARFYEDAFNTRPGLISGRRYRAASVAAMAGCGQGKRVGKLDEPARAHLRGLALQWLRDELAPWINNETAPELERGLRHWQADPAFAGVRDQEALDKLSATEQSAWRGFWEDVTKILQRSRQSPLPDRGEGS